jgi:hypothetical protein
MCYISAASADHGNELLIACRDQSDLKWGYCMGYIVGVAAASAYVCPPAEVTKGQMRDVVIRYLQNYPESRHQPAATLAATALSTA